MAAVQHDEIALVPDEIGVCIIHGVRQAISALNWLLHSPGPFDELDVEEAPPLLLHYARRCG